MRPGPIIHTVWEISSTFPIYALVLYQNNFLLHEKLNFLIKKMKKHLYVPYDPKNVQGLEIRGFWFQKKPVELKTAFWEVTTIY